MVCTPGCSEYRRELESLIACVLFKYFKSTNSIKFIQNKMKILTMKDTRVFNLITKIDNKITKKLNTYLTNE
jgi:hypothetical protein